jgi:putative hemolysin
MSPFTWVVIAALTALTALYVGAEFAAVSVRRSRIRQMAEEGNTLARSLIPFLDDPQKLDRYIAACQIGITLSTLVLGAYGQATLARWFGPLFQHWTGMQQVAAQSTAAAIVLVALTAFNVILGELVPKSLALTFPNQVALYTVLPMRWSLWLYSWFIGVLNGSGILILRLLGAPQTGHRHIHSPEEIELLIAESRDGGLLEPEESRRLHRALKLGVRPVRQLMVPRTHVAAVEVSMPVEEVLRRVGDSPYTRLPVYRGSIDQVVGLLHTKDLYLRHLENGGFTSIEQVMRPILTVPETLTADRLLDMMRERRAHQAVVLDEYGGLAGLVTLEDVLGEVLGEVADEFKGGQPEPEELPDGRVRLPGLMRLDEAEPRIGILWHGDADTVGGHVMNVLGRIPEPGERVTIDGVEVEVERVAGHAVTSLLARPLPAGEEVLPG